MVLRRVLVANHIGMGCGGGPEARVSGTACLLGTSDGADDERGGYILSQRRIGQCTGLEVVGTRVAPLS